MQMLGRRPFLGADAFVGPGVRPLFLVLLAWGGATVLADNLAVMPGVVAVADSEHRDRWGAGGYSPRLVCDGNESTRWLSDNWEVTHSIVLLFPRLVRIRELGITWASLAMTPTRCVLHGLREGKWVQLKELSFEKPEPATTVSLEPIALAGLRLTQPPEGARLGADRRMDVAEIRVAGDPVEPVVAQDVESARRAVAAELRDRRRREDADRVAALLAVVMAEPKRHGFMGIIDRTDLERGRKNVATHAWAKALADRIIKDADWWVTQSDEAIWGLIPDGNPRALCPSFEKGCPIHGGARSTFRATIEQPYRWTCSKGGEVWYDGAVIKHPKTGQQVAVRDDGHGWVAPEGFPNAGRRYYFIAAYRYFLLGKLFSGPYEPDGGSAYQGDTPVVQLALAYAITGDARYAHKAAVMLNRLAELYRTYDGCVEGPSQRQDGYIGQTFERFLVQNLVLACDLIWDEIEKDGHLLRFFAARGGADYDGDGRATGADLAYNLQRNLLGYVYEYLHRLMPYFDGDFLMYEMTALSALAKCLGNAEIAREMLDSDVGLRVMLNNSWFRDGKFIYDSCGYNVGNAQTPLMITEWIHGFCHPPQFAKPLDVYHDPACPTAMLYDFLRHIDCDGRVPMIGDGGGGRAKALNTVPPYQAYDERALIRLPEQRPYYLARLLAAAEGDLEKCRQGRADWWLLFHAEPPETSTSTGPVEAPVPRSHLFDDSGIAILRAGTQAETRQHVCITFSKGSYGHGHGDKLAVNIFRYGYDFSADLGYPSTWTDLKCGGWETHTASHCTVMLDGQRQGGNVIGHLQAFAVEPPCDMIEASAEKAYAGAGLYRRTLALVRDDDGEPLYTADLFRVAGATTRDYLFHSLGKPQDLSIRPARGELMWVKQEGGSLAGPTVAPMSSGGYGFLFDVQRAKGDLPFTATWRPSVGTSQPIAFYLHMLGAPGRELIRASGEGPGIRGQSPIEGHLVVRDKVGNTSQPTCFVSLLEAQRGPSRITSLAELPTTGAKLTMLTSQRGRGIGGTQRSMGILPMNHGQDARATMGSSEHSGNTVAIQVEATTSTRVPRTDIIISALDDGAPFVAKAGQLTVDFQGRFGLVTIERGAVTSLTLVGGGHLACAGRRVEHPGSLRGQITAVDVEARAITVRTEAGSAMPGPDLVGRKLLVRNQAYGYPSVYTIQNVARAHGELWRLTLNLPLIVARGRIGAVNRQACTFSSATPVMKLRVNPGLFDGKVVRTNTGGEEHRLRTATESAFQLADAESLPAITAGGEYRVIDVGADDQVEAVSQVSKRF